MYSCIHTHTESAWNLGCYKQVNRVHGNDLPETASMVSCSGADNNSLASLVDRVWSLKCIHSFSPLTAVCSATPISGTAGRCCEGGRCWVLLGGCCWLDWDRRPAVWALVTHAVDKCLQEVPKQQRKQQQQIKKNNTCNWKVSGTRLFCQYWLIYRHGEI